MSNTTWDSTRAIQTDAVLDALLPTGRSPRKNRATPKRRDVIRAKRVAVRAWQLSSHPGAVKLRAIYPVY